MSQNNFFDISNDNFFIRKNKLVKYKTKKKTKKKKKKKLVGNKNVECFDSNNKTGSNLGKNLEWRLIFRKNIIFILFWVTL